MVSTLRQLEERQLDVRQTWTYPNQLIISSSGEILAIRAEADGSNVNIASDTRRLILQSTNLVTSVDVIDLSRMVAPGGDVLAVVAEANAADNAVVLQRVRKVDIKQGLNVLVEGDGPVVFCRRRHNIR